MKHADKTVTIYHGSIDPDKGYDVYKGCVLTGVSFFGKTATAVSKDGLEAASEAIMRIPIPADITICSGDLVLLGVHPVNGMTPSTLSELADYVYTVVGVTHNSAGRSPHIKVVMK